MPLSLHVWGSPLVSTRPDLPVSLQLTLAHLACVCAYIFVDGFWSRGRNTFYTTIDLTSKEHISNTE